MNGFHFLLPLDAGFLAVLRHDLGRWLALAEVPDPLRADLILATHEAAANAIDHSGACEPVSVHAFMLEGDIIIEVHDTGQWADGRLITAGRGRGLSLMKSLVSDVEILKDPRGTTVCLLENAR